MNESNAQGGRLMENEAVRQFYRMLVENNRPDAGQDYSILLWQMESMAEQLKAASQELAQAREQLAKMQESPEKGFVSRTIDVVDNRIHAMQEGIMGLKEQIITCAKEAAAGIKQAGVKALDKAVSAIGAKKTLEAMQKNLSGSITEVKQSIEKVEAVGKELRSAGGHLMNAGRAAAGKEMVTVDGGTEDRFQAAVLAPLRAERNILNKLNNLTLAAIGSVERLEQAAGKTQPEMDADAASRDGKEARKETATLDGQEQQPDKAEEPKEKPSVLKDLKEKKHRAAAHTAPAPDKGRKAQEAAL